MKRISQRDMLQSEIARLTVELNGQKAEVERLRKWVDDLQSEMYVNCVYCGHRYGPEDKVATSMADALKQHIEQCQEHPMSKLQIENARLRAEVERLRNRLSKIEDMCVEFHECGPTIMCGHIIVDD